MRISISWAAAAAVSVAAVGCGGGSDGGSSSAIEPRAQALTYARDDVACAADADCCVVFDACRATGLIVGAADATEVAALLASAANDACVRCIAPAVQVRCVAGRCTGLELEATGAPTSYPSDFARDHCGALDVPAGWSETASAASSLETPTRFRKVLGCGG